MLGLNCQIARTHLMESQYTLITIYSDTDRAQLSNNCLKKLYDRTGNASVDYSSSVGKQLQNVRLLERLRPLRRDSLETASCCPHDTEPATLALLQTHCFQAWEHEKRSSVADAHCKQHYSHQGRCREWAGEVYNVFSLASYVNYSPPFNTLAILLHQIIKSKSSWWSGTSN